jgi:hypothetical protein
MAMSNRRAVRWADFLAYGAIGERRRIWGEGGAEAEILDREWRGQGAGQIGDDGYRIVTVRWVRSGHTQKWRQCQGYIVPRRDGGWGWSVTPWERVDE